MNYFNKYFSKAGFTGDFTDESIVIVENLDYFTSFAHATYTKLIMLNIIAIDLKFPVYWKMLHAIRYRAIPTNTIPIYSSRLDTDTG